MAIGDPFSSAATYNVTVTDNTGTWHITTPWYPSSPYQPDQINLNPVFEYTITTDTTRRLTEQEQPPMRGLYKVYIINLKTDQVTEVGPLVAADEDTARLKAILSHRESFMVIEESSSAGSGFGFAKEDTPIDDVESFDFVVTKLGPVKPKIKTRGNDD